MTTKPDYMGTWVDSDNKSKGYFFMCILETRENGATNESHITGMIEDILGTARFKGQFIGDKIHFEKLYLREGAFPTIYNGTKKNGIYEGAYTIDEGLSPKTKEPIITNGTFILEKCPESKTLELILEYLQFKNLERK